MDHINGSSHQILDELRDFRQEVLNSNGELKVSVDRLAYSVDHLASATEKQAEVRANTIQAGTLIKIMAAITTMIVTILGAKIVVDRVSGSLPGGPAVSVSQQQH